MRTDRRSFAPGRVCVSAAALAFLSLIALQGSDSQPVVQCPNTPVVTTTSPIGPTDVCIPNGFSSNENPIAFFDDFSWRSFIAMVWPAMTGQRGTPDLTKKASDAGPRVFETFKSDWEIFKPSGVAPSDWNVIDQTTPCGTSAISFGDIVLASFSKFGNLGEAGFGSLVHALPAQNKKWTRYLTAFNRTEFQQIASNQLYLRANVNKGPVTFTVGSVDVKSAWIEMTNISHPERYYTRVALALDPVTGKCSSVTVGLVGLHIVQKTSSRPQWIWSTFEQVDNVPPSSGNAGLAFNDGTAAPMPSADPNGGFPPSNWATPKLYNVMRIKPIHSSTQQTNAAYQQAIGGVWQFYRLVLTQWPLQLNPPSQVPASQTGDPQFTFPGVGTDQSAFANTTLETWNQNSVDTSCMACHTLTQSDTDFVWTVPINAFPSIASPNSVMFKSGAKSEPKAKASLPPSLQRLRQILMESNRPSGRKP